jgi:hypothetical protein
MPHEGARSGWIMPWNSEGLCNESVRRSVELASMASGEWKRGPSGAVSPDARRRVMLAVSIIGMVGGILSSMFESGLVRRQEAGRRAGQGFVGHPPLVPGGAQSATLHAIALLWSGAGSGQPWKPVLAAGASAAGAGAAVRALSRPTGTGSAAWTGCALVDLVSHLAAFAWAVSEAADAACRPRPSEA